MKSGYLIAVASGFVVITGFIAVIITTINIASSANELAYVNKLEIAALNQRLEEKEEEISNLKAKKDSNEHKIHQLNLKIKLDKYEISDQLGLINSQIQDNKKDIDGLILLLGL